MGAMKFPALFLFLAIAAYAQQLTLQVTTDRTDAT